MRTQGIRLELPCLVGTVSGQLQQPRPGKDKTTMGPDPLGEEGMGPSTRITPQPAEELAPSGKIQNEQWKPEIMNIIPLTLLLV